GLNLTYADYPRFSPDGRWLALRSEYAFALVDMTTQQVKLLDEADLGNMPPVWSNGGFEAETTCS
ncbi:MAG: hypothetical protein K8F30_13250, partial [Taibaiella sp.]|nr:hypothetical protein [Taibaiella sp.]